MFTVWTPHCVFGLMNVVGLVGLVCCFGKGTVTADGDLAPGTVGAVLSCNELRLKD